MLVFICKRLALLIPLLLFVSFIVFSLLYLSPVDPAFSYLTQSQIPPTQEALQEARIELGLDKPFLEQYFTWLKNAIMLDFGNSYVTKRAVLDDILYYLPTTLNLTFLAMFFIVLVSIPVGILAAYKKDSIWDKIIIFFSFSGVSFPSFWFGFLLIYIFSLKFNVLIPYQSIGFERYILPTITLALMSLSINIRLVRSSILEHKNDKSLFYAKARGLSKQQVQLHLLKNSLLPVVTSFGMHFGELLGGAVVVEILFALPGLGRYAVSAIYSHDYPVLQCFMLFMTTIFICVNLLVDIFCVFMNPKIRYEKQI
ncbi:nickel ABC transporter permease subunit NikB [Helicobacter monodelphidis]|uniref:ABC transporter permease subunit n=1 Tax=Helicobacter sp. 15-1451 TaxID=2004995 RepID=UPI000DCD5435|nr:ABC transporter permease subunit [Helicobacter sp. 15-1451]RAX57071.1 nickel ABC transporter permease subunit NikB [Helicobacter sp. 15-1451]